MHIIVAFCRQRSAMARLQQQFPMSQDSLSASIEDMEGRQSIGFSENAHVKAKKIVNLIDRNLVGKKTSLLEDNEAKNKQTCKAMMDAVLTKDPKFVNSQQSPNNDLDSENEMLCRFITNLEKPFKYRKYK